MDKNWLKHYDKDIPESIQVDDAMNIAGLLEDACYEFSNQPALHCMGRNIKFKDLNRYAGYFASFLQNKLKVQKGDRIGIMLPNVLQFPIAFFASQKIGAICVNTNPLYTAREMQHQFQDSGIKVLVIMDLFLDKLEQIIDTTSIKHVISTNVADLLPPWKRVAIKSIMNLKGLIPKHTLNITPFNEALEEGKDASYRTVQTTADDIALLQYTGGTTGVAKGAMISHRNIIANVRQNQAWSKPYIKRGEETVLTALPLYHIFSLTVNFISFVSLGGKIVLIPRPVPIENTVKVFKKHQVTIMTGVNTLFNALNNNPEFQKLAPKSLKFVVSGAMSLQSKVGSEFHRLTGTKILEGYGLTEASPVTHCNPLHVDGPAGSIGFPFPSTESRIVDENGDDVPYGEPGELIIRGPQVMQGYWNRPEETANTLRDGWLWTGDVASRDENGYFFIVDRKKDMIIVSGFNVYPNEVEDVICDHPKVLEAAVVGETDPERGEIVKAFVVPKDPSLNIDDLKKHCQDHLTGYKRPRIYEIVDELPKSNVGKILRRKLRAS